MKSKSTIEAKYLRSNVSAEFTKLFKEVDIETQKSITRNIKLLPEEIATLCFVPSDSYWWILTTSRLFLYEKGVISNFYFEEIKSIEPKEIFDNETTKQNSTILDLNLKNGTEIKLRVEKNTWHVIYSLLKFVKN